ncbi:unnamed protein product [Rhizophagus irregularis]|nr:unnamed protein product [Rhizophagus irregularis]
MDALLLDGKLLKAEPGKLLRMGSRISLISKLLYAIVLYLGSKNAGTCVILSISTSKPKSTTLAYAIVGYVCVESSVVAI